MANELMLKTPEPLLSMIGSCEVHCTAYCCGLGAFETGKEQVGYWVGKQPREQALLALEQLNSLIAHVKPDSVVTFWEGFGHDLSAEECLKWLNEWKESLEQNVGSKNGQLKRSR